jgi:phosphatidylglycerophosphate synthase
MEATKNFESKYDYKNSLKEPNDLKLNKFLRLNRYIYRPVASLIVRMAYKTRITPNQLTVLSFFLGAAGAVLFLEGKQAFFIAGAIIVQLSHLLDVADGMLARAKNMGSDYGAFLDLFLDRVSDFLIISGIAVGLYNSTKKIELLVIGLLAVSLYFLQVCLFYITNHFQRKEKTGETEEGRAFLLLAILVFASFDRLDIFVYGVVVETCLNIMIRMVRLAWMKNKLGPMEK